MSNFCSINVSFLNWIIIGLMLEALSKGSEVTHFKRNVMNLEYLDFERERKT